MSFKLSESLSNSLELIKAVQKVYNKYLTNKINQIWITLKLVMNEIVDHHRGNDYKISLIGKGKIKKQGRLPVLYTVKESL